MRSVSLYIILQVIFLSATAQTANLDKGWKFRQAGTSRWYNAIVPGSVHANLFNNKLIPDPFYSDNEKNIEWIDKADWEYKKVFTASKEMLQHDKILIKLDGLDTYASVFINNRRILQADNMFRTWQTEIKKYLKPGKNELRIYFHSAKSRVDSIAKTRWPLVLPDNPRVYARKAQYQFGWDWGPQFIGAGIWKPVIIWSPSRGASKRTTANKDNNSYTLVQSKDSIGTSFYFTKNGQPVYIKGANWIPAHAFPSSAQRTDYRQLLLMAKDAGMNILRVWGGGIYESDDFYELCDSLNIMVWQDFMFAGGMYPGDQDFFANVKAEVKDQIRRLSNYKCIVLWCGNNEIDEAWHHWGWQNQFNLHGADSAKVWNDYTSLFRDSLKIWVKNYDRQKRPYVSTSPQYGWGNSLSYTNGDSHYWGLWWGLEGWEKFKTHTGRFVSEWGMQAMPDYSTVEKYTPADQRYLYSPAVNAHQKASNGFMKLNHYIHQYFFDTTKLHKLSLEEYTYLTQCVQYYILKNSIATQMSRQPHNMGTLIWQLNDCWPVTSWSLVDFYKKPKAGYYAAKKQFLSGDTTTDALYPKDLQLKKGTLLIRNVTHHSFTVTCNTAMKYVAISLGDVDGYLSDNYFDLKPHETKTITYNGSQNLRLIASRIKAISLEEILSK